MDADTYMPVIVIIVAIYTWGCLNRGWTSPVDIAVGTVCRAGGHRWCGHDHPWSDEGDLLDEDDDPPMPTHGPLRPPKTFPAAALTSRYRVPEADPDSQDLQPGETRMAWTRRQIDAGILTRSEIDAIGAEKFGVHPRTVRRWREALGDAKDGQTDDRPESGRPKPARRQP
jgi:hypothetical protein